ncbi:hypothetical protein SAMN05216176_101718 [Nitratireductor indicus]|nr:hypothetical protein SAMN05216176_101718 [Nitratireductor indicus]
MPLVSMALHTIAVHGQKGHPQAAKTPWIKYNPKAAQLENLWRFLYKKSVIPYSNVT